MDKFHSKPRVLIIAGQPFNYSTGLGITMGNLFRGFPKNAIAQIYYEHICPDTQVCNRYYRLDEREQRWLFPMNILRCYKRVKRGRAKVSGVNTCPGGDGTDGNVANIRQKGSFVGKLAKHAKYFRRFRLSSELHQWIREYNPDMLYCCVVSLSDIVFVLNLARVFRCRLVIHMLDDWPNLLRNERSCLIRLWSFLVDWKLKILFRRADLLLGICDEMCNEYSRRSGIPFFTFHNCPEPDTWIAHGRKEWVSNGVFSFVFTGVVYDDFNYESLRELVTAICTVNSRKRIKCTLTIYSDSENALDLLRYACGMECVQVKVIDTSDEVIARIYGQADGLLLPFDFSSRSVAASRLSFPTKMPTYMLSSTPIFVYGPMSCATVKYFKVNSAAYVVDRKCTTDALTEEIERFCRSTEARRIIGGKARVLAEETMSAGVVRTSFEKALSSLVHERQ